MSKLTEKNLVRAMAMVNDAYACVELTEENIEDSWDYTYEEDRLPKSCAGTYISCVIPTMYVKLGYLDMVRHAKGIIFETPTLAPGDYAGGVEVHDCESDGWVNPDEPGAFEQAYLQWCREIGMEHVNHHKERARKALAAYRENEDETGLWTPLDETPEGACIGNLSGTHYN